MKSAEAALPGTAEAFPSFLHSAWATEPEAPLRSQGMLFWGHSETPSPRAALGQQLSLARGKPGQITINHRLHSVPQHRGGEGPG